jgi:hypothetical protein
VHGTDYNVSHGSAEHTKDPVADIKVQMKATSTIAREIVQTKEHFSFQLDNKDLGKLNVSPVHIPRLLVVLLLLKDQSEWLRVGRDEPKRRVNLRMFQVLLLRTENGAVVDS